MNIVVDKDKKARLGVLAAFALQAALHGVALAAPPPAEEAKRQLAAINVQPTVARLVQYCAEGDTATVELLLAAGVSPTASDPVRKVTPLHGAAAQGHAKLVERLLGLGVKVDAQDWNGNTPLIDAAYYGRGSVIDLLLAKGARIDVRPSRGPTALIAAVQSGSLAVVEKLLAAGADPKLADAAGQTPLAAAQSSGRKEIAARLAAATGRKP